MAVQRGVKGLTSIADVLVNPHNTLMDDDTDTSRDELCFCESGLPLSQCCGVEGRTALTADVFAYVSTNGITSEDTLPPQLQSAIESVSNNPDLFPARVNLYTDKAWFVKMTRNMYRECVFLDPGRINGTCLVESDLNWLKIACEQINWQPTAFIFHSAFCGSTLMSQILETVYQCMSLREPELLSSMLIYNRSDASDEDKHFWFDNLQNLLSRRYSPQEPVIVKANDYANPLMPDILQWKPDVPILFMYTPLNEFIAGCLKAENRREWIKQRYDSIKALLPDIFKNSEQVQIDDASHGQLAAAYWCYNLAIYLQVCSDDDNKNNNVRSLDFNAMLANPKDTVRQCAELFALTLKDNVDVEAAIGERMGVYSKNSGYKYSAEQRSQELQNQIDQNPEEQRAGETLARKLFGDKYPVQGLPGKLPN